MKERKNEIMKEKNKERKIERKKKCKEEEDKQNVEMNGQIKQFLERNMNKGLEWDNKTR